MYEIDYLSWLVQHWTRIYAAETSHLHEHLGDHYLGWFQEVRGEMRHDLGGLFAASKSLVGLRIAPTCNEPDLTCISIGREGRAEPILMGGNELTVRGIEQVRKTVDRIRLDHDRGGDEIGHATSEG